MPLTPLDIEARRFRREIFGYSRNEVNEFLRAVADSLSQVNLEKEEFTRLYQDAHTEVDDYRQRERSLMDALTAAQKLAEERRKMAQDEAERIIAEARHHAEQMLGRTRAEMTRIEQQILRLKVERETFENRLAALLDEHRRLLDVRRQEAGVSDRLRPRSTVPPNIEHE